MTTQALKYQFELFGAYRGATKSINGHMFINGRCDIICDSNTAPYLMKYLSNYGAYAMGTPDYNAAAGLVKEPENGANDTDTDSERNPTNEVQGGVSAVEQQIEETGTDTVTKPVDSEGGDAGERSNGDGHGHSGLPTLTEFQDRVEPTEPESVGSLYIKEAVLKLDPDNDEHWTAMGLPKVDAVEEAYGKAGVTRSDIRAVFPDGWNREKAIESALNV